jgi:hypothetical protein
LAVFNKTNATVPLITPMRIPIAIPIATKAWFLVTYTGFRSVKDGLNSAHLQAFCSIHHYVRATDGIVSV